MSGVDMLVALIRASVRFRFLVVALAVGLMIVGIARLPKMPVDVLPETSPVVVQLQTEAQGLSAEEVESLVTMPLEKTLLEGVLGVVNVTSDSIPGLSSIVLHFAPGTNLYQARQLVQERLSGAFILPNVSKPPVMLQPLSTTSDVMIVGLSSDTLSQIDLSVLSRWTIVPRLLGVAGVANVSTFGQADRQLQVLVQPATLAADHVSLAQVISATGNSQLVSPLSYLQGSTPGTGGFLENQNQRLTIRHILPFGTPSNLGQVPVANQGKSQILLSQVAQVVQGHQPLIGAGLVSGKPGLVLVIQKLPGASVPGVTSGVQQALTGLRPALTGVTVNTSLFRPASYLATARSNVELALIVAGILALLALTALLLSSRLVFAALAAMALSLVAATLLLQAFGYSFNSLVLLGLVVALAVVVDDAARAATAVMTRVRTRRAGGQDPDLVADRVLTVLADSAGPFAGASVAAVLAAVPVFVATGLTASFVRPIVVAYGVAVAVSLVIALTVTPALTAVVMSWSQRTPRGCVVARQLTARYTALLHRALRVPKRGLAAAAAVGIVALAVAIPNLHPDRPQYQDRNLVVNWTGAPGMALPELSRVSTLASHELMGVPGVQDVAATLGRAVTSNQIVNTDVGKLWVTMKPTANYGQTLAGIRAVVDDTPGMTGSVSTYENDAMAGVLTGQAHTETVRIYGPELPVLANLAGRVRSIMAGVPGMSRAHVIMPVMQPTINVTVNIARARAEGLAPGDVRREAGALLSGLTVGNFFEQQKVFDVVVWAQPSARSSIGSIENMLIDNGNGGVVRLGDVATITTSSQPADIQHQAMSPYLDVSATVTGGAQTTSAAVTSRLAAMRFPLEYHAQLVSTGPGGGTPAGRLITYALAALLGIILVIQAILGSWRLAGIVLGAVILAVAVAALTALAVGGSSLGATAAILGVIAIALRQAVGVTVRIRRGHAADRGELSPALLTRAAAESAPPVLTSAAVTAVILLPFIFLGDVAGNELTRPASIVLFFGLLAATAVNMLLLPAAYLLVGPTAAITAASEEGGYVPLRSEPSPGPPAAAFSARWRMARWRVARWRVALPALAIAVACVAGCGSSAPTDSSQAPPARMEHVGHNKALSVVLTPLGAERIGLKVAAAAASGTQVTVPYSALLYEPNGQTAVYTRISSLVFTRQFVAVASINGDRVVLNSGIKPGTDVVTQGGEELLGVQNGIGVET
jgi:Cu/Ag efflux pump CusA